MTRFRLPKIHEMASALDSLRERWSRGSKGKGPKRGYRRMTIDALERRELLSLAPVQMDDMVVNALYSARLDATSGVYSPAHVLSQSTIAGQSVAVDHDGDMVVTWTREELIADLVNGGYVTDTNVYARYLTDEVQRITFDPSLVDKSNYAPGTTSTLMHLTYGGDEIQQKISFSATYEPGTSYQAPIVCTVGFEFRGTTITFDYNETLGPEQNAKNLYNTLIGSGFREFANYASFDVQAINAKEFLVIYSAGGKSIDATQPQGGGNTVEELEILPNSLTIPVSVLIPSFYPMVTVKEISKPYTFTLPISLDNAGLTAWGIQQYFLAQATDRQIAPTVPRQVYIEGTNERTYGYAPNLGPDDVLFTNMEISVTPVLKADGTPSLSAFDVTFVGNAGKRDQLLLEAEVADANGVFHTADVETTKQSSPEFRVNPAEADNAFTPYLDTYDQAAPAVAMDSDGDFVITWQSEVFDLTTFGTTKDIFAQRFTPLGGDQSDAVWTDGNGMKVGNVFGVDTALQVNTTTANPQTNPAIAMDYDGNFTIVWENNGQEVSYFNGVLAQRFDNSGQRVGSEMLVTPSRTSTYFDPAVAASHDGKILVMWTERESSDTGTYHYQTAYAKVFASDGQELLPDFVVPASDTGSSANWGLTGSWDLGDQFVIAWNQVTGGNSDDDNADPHTDNNDSMGVRAEMYRLPDPADSTEDPDLPVTIRDVFRANSANDPDPTGDWTDPNLPTTWPLNQWGAQAALDADGDLIITYEGFGPDIQELDSPDPFGGGGTQDWDGVLEDALIALPRLPSGQPDAWSIGTTRELLDATYTLTRGAANDIMFSRWDAGATGTGAEASRLNVINSDSPINATRDGHNTRFFIEIDNRASSGGFTISISTPTGYVEELSITPVYATGGQNPVLDPEKTRKAIEDALRTSGVVGENWLGPLPDVDPGPCRGPVAVSIINDPSGGSGSADFANRQNSDWALWAGSTKVSTANYVFEVTFLGEMHDLQVWIGLSGDGNQITFPNAPTGALAILHLGYITMADSGTVQTAGSLGMEPDGDFATVWTQMERPTNGVAAYRTGPGFECAYTPSNENIYVREMNESTDTAGPLVTDFLNSEDGSLTSLKNGAQVNAALQAIVVTFDEAMMIIGGQTGAHSVVNPNNWALMYEGQEILGGISQIYYGMDVAYDLSLDPALAAQFGLEDVVRTNKWQAVVVFDSDGVAGNAATPAPLKDGTYQLVAKNSLRDKAGNALGLSGFAPNGELFSREFTVLVPSGSEVLVNKNTTSPTANYETGNQYTLEDTPELFGPTQQNLIPNSPQSVATDADGDQVTVWTSNGTNPGVYAKLYDATWTNGASGRTLSMVEKKTIKVSDIGTATYAGVAMDADGDFVVTWSQQDAGDWNVYARQYDAVGTALGSEFRVNSETVGIQRFSTVAMDTDGDFIIAWQSQGGVVAEGRDNSGYGIYAQRYTPAGRPVGGVNEMQILSLVRQPTGSFQLQFDHDSDASTAPLTTGSITIPGSVSELTDLIEAELEKLDGNKVDVNVQMLSQTEWAITFVGAYYGSRDVGDLTAIPTVSNPSVPHVEVVTSVEGTKGEFLVNDTTANNQMFPSAAMSADGGILISWTSSGQDGDAAYERNIYAKRFLSNDAYYGGSDQTNAAAFVSRSLMDGIRFRPLVVAADDPGAHVVTPPSGYEGVCQVFASLGWYGSGTLLANGKYVLTAAHVVWNDASGQPLPASAMSVTFTTSTGTISMPASEIFVYPGYNGDPTQGGDLALIQLAEAVPGITGFDIYRGTNELGSVGDIYGYGWTGTGDTGETQDPGGLMRTGQNKWEGLGNIFGFSDATLVYDFDNGLPENDAFGRLFGISDLGLGDNEASSASGDSGGPTFLNGQIAAVTSLGVSVSGAQDVSPGPDASFGDFSVDTRVSTFASWIDSVSSFTGTEFLVNANVYQRDANGQIVVDPVTQEAVVLEDNQTNDQKWSAVAMDADGDFVITWTSYGQDGTGSGPGPGVKGENAIYARRYGAGASAATDPFLVNTFTEGNQQHSQVAMDANGDYVITWESMQDRVENPTGVFTSSFGIYAQRFSGKTPQQIAADPYLGPHGEIGSEMAINSTQGDAQRYPSIAMDDAGDFVIVWAGSGTDVPPPQGTGRTDTQGIFEHVYRKSADDTGAAVAETWVVGDERSVFYDGEAFGTAVTKMIISFTEDMSVKANGSGVPLLDSIKHLKNWQLTKDGAVVTDAVLLDAAHPFWLNPATGKYEATILFDLNVVESGNQALDTGTYELRIQDSAKDIFGNALDGDYNGTPGGDFVRTFTIYTGDEDGGGPRPDVPDPPGQPGQDETDTLVNTNVLWDQSQAAVAWDNDGNYVVVWVEPVYGATGLPDPTLGTDIKAQRFTVNGPTATAVGNVISVNTSTYALGDQLEPDVAMTGSGDFVVTWSGAGPGDTSGVFARVFQSGGTGDPIGGAAFAVAPSTVGAQFDPHVAIASNGNYVITWTAPDSQSGGIYARRFNLSTSVPLDTGQILVNTSQTRNQSSSDVAMDPTTGNFVVVWASDAQDGSDLGIYGQRFTVSGTKTGSEFNVNTYHTDKQIDPAVGMSGTGSFVVAWSSFLQDGSGYGVYRRAYNASGVAQGTSETRVSQTTANWQHEPAVAMSEDGKCVVSWTAYGQDNDVTADDGIYARIYQANGSDYVNSFGVPLGEFRVNAITSGNQVSSAVSMDENGDIVAVWEGPNPNIAPFPLDYGTDIYSRVLALNPDDFVGTSSGTGTSVYDSTPDPDPVDPTQAFVGTAGSDLFEFVGGATRSAWSLKVNGAARTIGTDTTVLNLDGLDGTDKVIITGTSAAESVELSPGSGVFHGTGYTINLASLETTVINGGGGSNSATLYDSSGDDSVDMSPTKTTMSGPGYSQELNGFATVHAIASSGGVDAAIFRGSSGNDTLTADPVGAKLSGTGFSLQIDGFDNLHAYATGGGADRAYLYDSAGDDTFKSIPTVSYLAGPGYYNWVKYFDYVYAYADEGGTDVARLSDSTGDDTFAGTPGESAMSCTGYYQRVTGFDQVIATATQGNDLAKLSDSAGKDTLTAKPLDVTLSSTGFSNQALGFDQVRAYSRLGGDDVANFYDSTGNDVFKASPTKASMARSGYYNEANGFYYRYGYATAGGTDKAYLYDSAGDDTYKSTPTCADLWGTGFYERAKYFDYVYAYGSDGYDVATLNDSSGNDTFASTPTYGKLSGSGYRQQVTGFDKVNVRATAGGYDQATLGDSSSNDVLAAGSNWAQLTNAQLSYLYWVSGFDKVTANSQNTGDTKSVTGTVDFLIATGLWKAI